MAQRPNPKEREILLALAREAVGCAARGDQVPAADLSTLPPGLRRTGASFVTLLDAQGELRGCIGTVEAHAPLAHDVQRNAVGSATGDPRFAPVGPEELEGLQIELSVLTPPRELQYDGPDDLLAKIRPGVDGVIVQKGWQRATLLPSVWEKIPDPPRFLEVLCLKAGLPGDAWRRPDLTVYTYQAEKIR